MILSSAYFSSARTFCTSHRTSARSSAGPRDCERHRDSLCERCPSSLVTHPKQLVLAGKRARITPKRSMVGEKSAQGALPADGTNAASQIGPWHVQLEHKLRSRALASNMPKHPTSDCGQCRSAASRGMPANGRSWHSRDRQPGRRWVRLLRRCGSVRGQCRTAAHDPSATLAVHCGNGFDARFEPYQSTRVSRYNAGR